MNQKSVIYQAVAALVAFSALSTFANDPQNCNGCTSAPTPISNDTLQFSLDIAESAFQKGKMPAISDLEGSWKFVGKVDLPGAPDSNLKPFYDVTGRKNSDGSMSVLLNFNKGGPTGAINFEGNPIYTPDSVTIYNLGKKDINQGPNQISFLKNDQTVCFSQYSYTNKGQEYNDLERYSHFNSSCRLLKNDTKKMICQTALILAPDSTASFDDKKWNGKVRSYFAYAKDEQ